MQPKEIIRILQPQNELEATLLNIPEVQAGMAWGEPRFGHPEGKVVYHVREVLDNINAIPNLGIQMKAKLRLIAIVHDTFKHIESKTHPRVRDTHHSVLARRFMEHFTQEQDVLSTIELHDDAYYCWRKLALPRFANIGHHNLPTLLNQVRPFLQLYYLFFKCDTQTGDKNQAPLKWFERTVPELTIVPIRELRLA